MIGRRAVRTSVPVPINIYRSFMNNLAFIPFLAWIAALRRRRAGRYLLFASLLAAVITWAAGRLGLEISSACAALAD
jgi:hypothetical protein